MMTVTPVMTEKLPSNFVTSRAKVQREIKDQKATLKNILKRQDTLSQSDRNANDTDVKNQIDFKNLKKETRTLNNLVKSVDLTDASKRFNIGDNIRVEIGVVYKQGDRTLQMEDDK